MNNDNNNIHLKKTKSASQSRRNTFPAKEAMPITSPKDELPKRTPISPYLFRDVKKDFALLASDKEEGQALAQSLQQRTGHKINLIKKSDLRTPDIYNRQRYQNEKGQIFVQILCSRNNYLLVEETPQKNKDYQSSTDEIRFKNFPTISQLKEKNAEYLASLEIKTFEFTLTKTIIQSRQGAPRVRTQNQVMGQSAEQAIVKANVEPPKTGKKRLMHWAHYQGAYGAQADCVGDLSRSVLH